MPPRRAPLPAACPYFTERDVRAAERREIGLWKSRRRAELRQMGAQPRFAAPTRGSMGEGLISFGRQREAVLLQAPPPGARDRSGLPAAPALHNPRCVTTFDANTKVTSIEATASIDVPVGDLAQVIDPRGWGLSNGVIDVAFRVWRDGEGVYRPLEEDLEANLGEPWDRRTDRGNDNLLFEYARSEIASFENILMIDEFTASDEQIHVRYHLVDCLKTIIGFWGVDGGLQRNDGFIRVTAEAGGSRIQVVKNIRVRDMTPRDPGNRYDFGQTVNSTLGAALSLWVDDVSMMSPVF